jgi:DNA-binding GntR family transcriptional regulator
LFLLRSACSCAIAAAEPLAAQQAMRAHLSGTLAHLDEIRARFPHYRKDW